MISFIHVGKTGGTTVRTLLKDYKKYHERKNYEENEKYIIWIRHPIHRFISAFNFAYYGVHTDPTTIPIFDFEHTLIPKIMNASIGRSYVWSKKYDSLIRLFNSPNHLAESLSSDDIFLKEKAQELMLCEELHIFKGLGWYLENGKFVTERHNDILFIGAQENMQEDIIKLSTLLNKSLDHTLKIRENIYVDKSMKLLSPLAIENLMKYYKDTDYKTLKHLRDYNLISKEIFSSYCRVDSTSGTIELQI